MTDYRAERTAGKSGFVATVDTGGTQPADPDGQPGKERLSAWRRRVRGAGNRPDAAAADRTHRDHLHVGGVTDVHLALPESVTVEVAVN